MKKYGDRLFDVSYYYVLRCLFGRQGARLYESFASIDYNLSQFQT